MNANAHGTKDCTLNVRLSTADRDLVHFGARLMGITASELARRTLVVSARAAVAQAGDIVVAIDGGSALRDH